MNWLKRLKYDPIKPLTRSNDIVLQYFADRDLLDKKTNPIRFVREQPEVERIIKKQTKDGFWQSRQKDANSVQNYNLIETWKQLRFLAEKYELDKRHGCVAKAAEYIFSCQTGDGDIRGFLGNQYAAYYTGAVLSLLVKAGYEDDPRVDKAFRWLLSSRQNDGGWIGSPMIHPPWKEQIKSMTTKSETVKTWDRTKPLCVNSTGMILRAFASHPAYRKREEAVQAAKTLKKYFFWRTTIPRTATRTTGCVFNSLTGGIT